MSFKILAGPKYNILTRAAVAPAMTPSALTGFGADFMCDGRAAVPAKFSVAQEDSEIVMDLNVIPGGDFEGATDNEYWTPLTTGSLSIDSGSAYAGAQNLLLTPLVNDALAVLDVEVRVGELATFTAAVSAEGTSAKVFLRNRQTGKWLQADGSWQTAASYATATAFVESTGGWEFETANLQVDSLATCRDDTVWFRVYLLTTGGTAAFDSILLWPWPNWFSVHGHNIPPFISPVLARSADASSWTTVTTLTPVRDSFYHSFAATSEDRYLRLLLDGNPDTASLMYFGELVAGYAYDLIRNPRWGGSVTFNERQTRLETVLGEQHVHLHGARPQRSFAFDLMMTEQAEYEQIRDVVFRGSRGGANTIVIAPVEMDPSLVIMGRIRETISIEKTDPNYDTGFRRAELEVVEAALPGVHDDDVVHAYDEPIVEIDDV